MNVVEDDLGVIWGWFAGVDFKFSYRINVELHNAGGGAGWETPPDIATWVWFHPTVTVKAVGSPPPEQGLDYVRYLLVSEVTEMCMASKDNGWFEHTTLLTSGDEGSKGEGLSRFLGHQFCLAKGITPWFSDYAVVPLWLISGARPNYVDSAPDDHQPDVATGGTTCFIYYLHDQLGFAIPDIISAGSTNLAGVYQKLTGRTDAWASFINLVNLHYPLGTSLTTTGDNIFPVPNLWSLELGLRVEAGRSVQMFVSLDRVTPVDVRLQFSSDDPTSLQVPAVVTIPAGKQDALVVVRAQPVPGPPRVITIHATYAGATVNAPVTVLPAPSILAGVVTDAAGNRIPRAAVLIDSAAPDGVHVQLSTGSDGSYNSGPVPPDSYTLEASAAEHVTVRTTVVVREGVPTTDVNFALDPTLPFTVLGTVSDPGNTPIPGVTLTLFQNGPPDTRIFAVTDSAGNFRLSMDPGIYSGDYTLLANHPGYTSGQLVITIPNGATLPESFVLAKVGSLTGTVTDGGTPPAVPVAGGAVQAGPDTGVSDATGHYQLETAPGPTIVTVRADGFENSAATIDIAAGGVTNHDFALVTASATLTGSVYDGNTGDPIHEAFVSVTGGRSTATTGFDGSYTISRIPAGHAQVIVNAHGHPSLTSTLDFTAHETVTRNYTLASSHPNPHLPT
jgi:hypothetical protein